jgi:hypothetical protein
VERIVPRYSFEIDVELTEVLTGNQLSARTENLSLFGCNVNAKPFLKGTGVGIKLYHKGRYVSALGRVVYTTQSGMGIVFTGVEREHERILEQWIADFAVNVQVKIYL